MKLTLVNYIARYQINKRLLAKHPEQSEMLNIKINEAEQEILKIVTKDDFTQLLNQYNF